MTEDAIFEQLKSIAERLIVLSPDQSFQGAHRALSDLLTEGIGISLAERFEFPRQVIREIQNLAIPLVVRLQRLDAHLTDIGVTPEVIAERTDLIPPFTDQDRIVFRELSHELFMRQSAGEKHTP